jgi:hypothetical protein
MAFWQGGSRDGPELERRAGADRKDDGMTSSICSENRFLSMSLALAAAALLAGCGDEITGVTNDADDPRLGAAIEAISADNGMSQNGMSQNGMSQNGMSQNGMSQNGFGTTAFQDWFNANPALSDEVMRYTAKCAAAAGQSYTWKNPSTNVTYTWTGLLGLAPGFAAGQVATSVEQELISACLAMHVNKFGVSVPISVRGWDVNGKAIAMVLGEAGTYSQREGAFFGNLFDGTGVFSCYSPNFVATDKTSARACAFSLGGAGSCPPMASKGKCDSICAKKTSTVSVNGTLTSSMEAFEKCKVNGRSFRTLTSWFQSEDLYTCGDGVCQISETGGACPADCP